MTVDLQALRNTIEELLCSRVVFDIDAFGWLNEDDVDPEYVGYAMWAQNPPYDHDFNGWQNGTPPGRAPTEAEQRLMELGHDFFGLMKTARHFIGFALLHQHEVQPLDLDPTDFDFNNFAALVTLSAADDRRCEFIIVTTGAKKAKKKGRLENAYDMLRTSGLVMEADALEEGFNTTRKVRDARNTATHELATMPAHVERQLIELERKAFEKKRWHNLGLADEDKLKTVEARAQLLCDCYVELVTIGELTFRVENEWRHRNNS